MKFLLTLFISFSLTSAQQSEPRYEVIYDSSLAFLLNNISLLKEVNFNELSIKIYELNNEPGNAGFENGEATSNIYIAVSEFDEYPNQSLFLIPALYEPKVEEIKKVRDEPELILSYMDKEKKYLEIKITLDKLFISKQ